MSRHLYRSFWLRRPTGPALIERMTQLRYASYQPAKYKRNTSSTANAKIDLPALEAKWQACWGNRRIDTLRDISVPNHQSTSLSPFYLRHIQKPNTILETLEWHYGKGNANTATKGRTLFDQILELSRPEADDFGAHTPMCGTDVILTSLFFRDNADIDIDQAAIKRIEQWFESIWKAVALAHGSYINTQVCPDLPNVPESLGEPGLGRWLDYIGNEYLQLVQVPPEEPDVSSLSTDEDTYRLWLVAQRAILAYTAPITSRNRVRTIRSRLVRLTNAIKAYDDADVVHCDMHYYSVHVLLALLAPLAPSFAEECWVLLHYGCQNGDNDGIEPRYDLDEDMIEEFIKETEDVLGRHHLPRQGRPDTLQSIFDQPFPIARQVIPSQI